MHPTERLGRSFLTPRCEGYEFCSKFIQAGHTHGTEVIRTV